MPIFTRLELLSVQRIDGSNQVIFVHRCILYPGRETQVSQDDAVSKHTVSSATRGR